MDPNYAATYGNYSSGGNVSPEATAGLMAFLGGMLIFVLIIILVIYVFMAICLMKIAKKTNTPNGWFAWIPILNVVLMLQIAKKPVWWVATLILFFIPFINIIAGMLWLVLNVIVWMAISRKCGKEEWLGILMIVPVANLFVPAYLAFSNDNLALPQAIPPVQPPMPPVQPTV